MAEINDRGAKADGDSISRRSFLSYASALFGGAIAFILGSTSLRRS
jgi:hypothetical protein